MRVFDVSNPLAPVEVAYYFAQGSLWGAIAVSAGYAYVAYGQYPTGGGYLRVFDVSTPSAPVYVGQYNSPALLNTAEGIGGVAVSGGSVYAASGDTGLSVFTECGGAIFHDGFESGDTSAWSATVP
jgi:hypothetical protein